MKKILLFLLIASYNLYAQAPDLIQCDDNNDGLGVFNLTVQTPILLNGESPADYTVTYYETLVDANTGANPIVNLSAYQTFTNPQTIYTLVVNNNSGGILINDFHLIVNPMPATPSVSDVTVCDSYTLPALPADEHYFTGPNGTGTPLFAGTAITASSIIYVFASTAANCTAESSFMITISPSPTVNLEDAYICPGQSYVLDTNLDSSTLTFQWFLNSVAIAGANQSTLPVTTAGVYSVEVTSPFSPCSASDEAIVYDSFSTGIFELSITDYEVTVISVSPGSFTYALDNGSQQNSNVFSDLSYGEHIITILDACGNVFNYTFTITTPDAPDGETSQTFLEGQTLADVVVDGENIQWYANDNTTTDRMLEATLPLTTVLQNNTTYYASQTINDVESANRLPVLVSLTLGLQNAVFSNLEFQPNPVKNTLHISNSGTIDKIAVFNLLGQVVLENTVQATTSQIDFSHLDSGIYLVKIQFGNLEKTVKIIKE